MATSKRINLVREHQSEYAGTEAPRLVQISAATYLAVDGTEHADREAACAALYAVGRRIRRAKRQVGHDFVLGPLEDLLWPGAHPGKPERWTLLLRVPPSVRTRDVLRARRDLHHNAQAEHVELRGLPEGPCVQMSVTSDAADRLASFAGERGVALRGPLHRIFGRDTVLRCGLDEISGPRRMPRPGSALR